ncbi:molybdopterin-dependent oxidoreductase [Thermodesulfovibrionales bacterium]|nr:molybdopterin-dependent oxidoreductase [Thermodesulfovibrionales bacterium]MCL0061949.1 molybdopterin-dependent oxidoreductase [Thermodesulfovibrionales bacterium]
MANMVNLTIDGKKVQSPERMNLIDAAELNGIHIPNLCYLKGSKGIGACRLCLVEIEGLKAPMVACTMKVKEGMIVNTKTEKVQEIRKFTIDLILSMHPFDCMTCTKAGICRLQEYAYDLGIKESSFTRKTFGYPTDETNPFIKRDPEYCILCGKCVRICKEQGTNVLGFMGRGVDSKVITANDKPLKESGCTFCGSCIDACPVNALLEADRWRKGREWEYEKINSVCLLCGNSCDITVRTKDGSAMLITAGEVEGSPERYICAYGRFGFDCIEADTRVTFPLIRVNGELRETTWQNVIDVLAKELEKSTKNSGFITTGSLLNEDALTLKRLVFDVVKTKNIDTTVSLYGDLDTLISGDADIESADLFVLVDLDPDQQERVLPALDAIIRRRVNAGLKLITINSAEPAIAPVAAANLVGDETKTLRSFAKAIIDKGIAGDKRLTSEVSGASTTEIIDTAATLFVEAENPIILTSPAMYLAAANISLLKGAAVSVPIESNAKGALMMGLTTNGKSYNDMISGGLTLLYAIGAVPLDKRPNVGFLIVQNSHLTELAKQADVVLPSAAFLEADGTIVDYLGRLRHVCKAVEPAGEAKTDREIFVDIAKAMGVDMKEAKESEAKRLIKIKTAVSFNPFARSEGLDLEAGELIESINAQVINGSRLLWLKEAEVASD